MHVSLLEKHMVQPIDKNSAEGGVNPAWCQKSLDCEM